MTNEETAEMTRADANTLGEIFNAAIFDAALPDEPQGAGDGVRCAKPGGRSRRTFGATTKTRTEAGVGRGGGSRKVAAIFFLGGGRGTDGAAVNSTTNHTDKKFAVEARIAREAGSRTGLKVQRHCLPKP